MLTQKSVLYINACVLLCLGVTVSHGLAPSVSVVTKVCFQSPVDSLVVAGNEHRVQWASDTVIISNATVRTKLTAPSEKVNQLPSESGTLALTTYSGYSLGSIVMYSGTVVPTGFIKCDGQAVSRTTYSRLFAVIGTKYGSGNGTTTFGLPNISHSVLNYAIRFE